MTEPTEPPDTTRRRATLWWIACAAVVIAAVVVTLVVGTGHAGGGENDNAGGTTTTSTASTTTSAAPASGTNSGYDLSSPEAAAESFAAAAAGGSGDTLLSLACVGHLPCVAEHAADLDAAQLADARAVISENAVELAHHLDGAEFAAPVDGAAPGTREVPYRTPAMADGTSLTLTFVQSGGEWLYLGPAT